MNIGFYLLEINQNNKAQQNIIQSINNLCALRPQDNIVLFNNIFNTIDINQKYYILSINQAKYFDGILFLFDTESALLTKTFPGPRKQILHLDKPEWSYNPALPYTIWHNIYMDNKFELLAGSKEIYDLTQICWKNPLKVINNYNAEEFNDVIQQLQ
jgi:hypothetical protein